MIDSINKEANPYFLTDTQVKFTYNGLASQVEIIGDMNCWSGGLHTFVEVTPNHWELILEVLPRSRLNYRLVIDGKEMVDDANPLTVMDTRGICSELRAVGFNDVPTLAVPKGTRLVHKISSTYLDNEYDLITYCVKEPPPSGGYALLVCYDGDEAEKYLNLPSVVDYLVELKQIPPIVCVMLPPKDRLSEYNANQAHIKYVINEVLPTVYNKFSVTRQPSQTLLMGVSMGASASVFTALHYPNVFGLVVAHSGIYGINNESIGRELLHRERLPLRFYLSCGQYESCFVGGKRFGATLDGVSANRNFTKILAEKGYDYLYVEAPDGHNWRMWQTQTIPALTWLFST